MKDSPLKESIIYTKNISLPYDQSTFSIDFAALSYTVPEMNEYSYKMEGVDKDWTIFEKQPKSLLYQTCPRAIILLKSKDPTAAAYGITMKRVWKY